MLTGVLVLQDTSAPTSTLTLLQQTLVRLPLPRHLISKIYRREPW
jgi:hypothetical protein